MGSTSRRRGVLLAAFYFLVALIGWSTTLDPSGDLDTTFSTDGKQSTNFALVETFAEARGVDLQSDGRIVVGGSSVEGNLNHFAFIRLMPDGTQDMSFGTSGNTRMFLGNSDLVNDVAIQSDDKVIGVGF